MTKDRQPVIEKVTSIRDEKRLCILIVGLLSSSEGKGVSELLLRAQRTGLTCELFFLLSFSGLVAPNVDVRRNRTFLVTPPTEGTEQQERHLVDDVVDIDICPCL
jgi:hypothetical protein